MDEALKRRLAACETDLEGAVRRFMGNTELYEKFLLRFPEDESVSDLRQALKDADFEAAFQAAHTLKGLAGNLGLTPLYRCAQAVTEALRAKQNDLAIDGMAALEAAYRQVLEALAEA